MHRIQNKRQVIILIEVDKNDGDLVPAYSLDIFSTIGIGPADIHHRMTVQNWRIRQVQL